MNNWNLDSWKKHVAKHMPNYENIDELDKVENKLASFPPLVFAGEVRSHSLSMTPLRSEIAFSIFILSSLDTFSPSSLSVFSDP